MPPAEEKVRPSPDEIALAQAMDRRRGPPAEAPLPQRTSLPWPTCSRPCATIWTKRRRARSPFRRYFTLTHLHNAGLSADELQSYRHGLSKLVNSLSWGKHDCGAARRRSGAAPSCASTCAIIKWNEKTWDAIVARNPYGIQADTPPAARCAEADALPAALCARRLVRGRRRPAASLSRHPAAAGQRTRAGEAAARRRRGEHPPGTGGCGPASTARASRATIA